MTVRQADPDLAGPRSESSVGDRPVPGQWDDPGVHAALASPTRRTLMARLRAVSEDRKSVV